MTTKTEMPDEIWAHSVEEHRGYKRIICSSLDHSEYDYCTRYIRADLVQPTDADTQATLDAFNWIYQNYVAPNQCSVANQASEAIRKALTSRGSVGEYVHFLPEANRDCEVCFCDSLGSWIINFKQGFRQAEKARAMIRAAKLYEKNMSNVPPMWKGIDEQPPKEQRGGE